jgi:acetylornithine deacetylase/succinyl-diaminopimelate desuccinylase family protein
VGDGAADAILAAVDACADELVAAVSAAVRIPSVTPNFPGERAEDHLGGEGRVARFVAEQLEPAGCEIDLFAVEEGRDNCVGVLRGTGGGRSLILNGHTDVVLPQPAEEWTGGDPWSGAVEDGVVRGRGSADMKGGLMCQVFALRALADAGVRLRGDLILQAVAGEEMMEQRLGTLACLERGHRADAAVVAEPGPAGAPLAVCPASCGFLLCEITVQGKATHSAMRAETIRPGRAGAALGVNAIDKAIPVHQALARLEEQWGASKSHPLFKPGSFTLHAGVVVGAPRRALIPFSLAEYTRFTYVIWYPPDESEEAIRAEIEAQVTHAAALDPWLREHSPVVEWKQHWGPARLEDPAHPIVATAVAAHERATGAPAVLAGFTAVCDATFLNANGVPAISYGPGDIAAAHAIDEHVAVDELVAATRTFALMALEWCGT